MHPVESSMAYGRFPSVAVADAATTDASAEELLAFERLLADLSARFANVPAEGVECEIQLAQTKLRQFLGFDRCNFGEFDQDGSLSVISSRSSSRTCAMICRRKPLSRLNIGGVSGCTRT